MDVELLFSRNPVRAAVGRAVRVDQAELLARGEAAADRNALALKLPDDLARRERAV